MSSKIWHMHLTSTWKNRKTTMAAVLCFIRITCIQWTDVQNNKSVDYWHLIWESNLSFIKRLQVNTLRLFSHLSCCVLHHIWPVCFIYYSSFQVFSRVSIWHFHSRSQWFHWWIIQCCVSIFSLERRAEIICSFTALELNSTHYYCILSSYQHS